MNEQLDPPGTPIIMAASAPFKLIGKDARDRWDATLKDINESTYDYLKLNRASGFIDGNVAPYMMLVGFDGTLAMPALPEFAEHGKALKIFNRVFLEMLLGGIYTEAATPGDICMGMLYKTGYIRMLGGRGEAARLHTSLRDKSASTTDTITLLGLKPTSLSQLIEAISRGRTLLTACDPLSPEIVLAGTFHYVRGSLAEALTSLWTCVEQLVSRIWRIEVEQKAAADGVPQRAGFLKDYRVWTTSARIELLFQKGLITVDLYVALNDARRARNNFIHSGTQPELSSVTAALKSLFNLFSTCATGYKDIHSLDKIGAQIEARCALRPMSDEERHAQPTHWREIARLPGEPHFEGKFKPFDLNLKPIDSFDPKYAKRVVRSKGSADRDEE